MKPRPRFTVIDLRRPEPRPGCARMILEPEPDALTTPDSARAFRPVPSLDFDPHGLSLTETSRHLERYLLPALEGMRCPTCATPAPIRPRPDRVQPRLAVTELAVLEADRKRLVCMITCPACRKWHDCRFEWTLPFMPGHPELDVERLTEIMASTQRQLRQELIKQGWYAPLDDATSGLHVSPQEYHALATDPGWCAGALSWTVPFGNLVITGIPIIQDPDLTTNRSIKDLESRLYELRLPR